MPAREIAALRRRVEQQERELERRANIISDLADQLASKRRLDEPGPFEYDWTLPPEVIAGAIAATRES